MERILDERPAELFRQLVHSAMDKTGVVSSQDTECYLVQLLDRFVRPDGRYLDVGHRPEHPLGKTLLDAVSSSGAERFVLLRFTGDMALFLSGFFFDSLDRRQVAPDYYRNVGETAYGQAADCCRPRQNASLFEELSGRFEDFSGVLHEVAETCTPRDPRELLRAYRQWLETGSERSAEKLERNGIVLAGTSGLVH